MVTAFIKVVGDFHLRFIIASMGAGETERQGFLCALRFSHAGPHISGGS
jgi:hypothetical protein